MDFPTADFPPTLLRDLLDVTRSIGLHDAELETLLGAHLSALRAAVPSYRGMQLTIVGAGTPVNLSTLRSPEDGEIRSSLRLSLTTLAPGFHRESDVVFYAAGVGAFVDLATDLGYATGLPVITGGPPSRLLESADGDGNIGHESREPIGPILLDADLPPSSVVAGLVGLEQMSTINRAVGMLIHQGHRPDEALARIHRLAASEQVEAHVYAARLLAR